ncbi:RNA-binding region RNP-1 domain-containing protein [Tubulinosema ratisbonensis]|uniref:RNA-binding region RNP-1 domain-containing protein n=1 Tax=Tubulinosema ratisbonensis TaxID=291195 RepID=A0A437AQ55_9MICR|nr:RNA-binding region RNP-1 domain-containing protein [Tubulinosema ratisbonensis]
MHKVVFKNLPKDLNIEEFKKYLNKQFTTTDVFLLTKNNQFTGVCFVTFEQDSFTISKYYNKSFYKNMRILCEPYKPKESSLSSNDMLVEENYYNYINQQKILEKEEIINILYLNLPKIFKNTDSPIKFFLKEQEMVNKIKEFFFNNNIHLNKLTNQKSKTKILVRGSKEIKTECKIITGPDSLVNIYEFSNENVKKGISELQKSVWEYLPLCECQLKNDLSLCIENKKRLKKEKYKKLTEKTDEINKDTKLIIKNLPFQATVNEIKKLFTGYKLKSIRIPVKRSGESRGFGFIECDKKTGEEIISKFSDCHFYGRRLHFLYAEN